VLVDAMSLATDPVSVTDQVRAAEAAGYDGWFGAETSHDPFVTTAVAATASGSIQLGTGIAVAFSRNPMDVAYSANDLQVLSQGRFVLGLGSQIKPHITKRFSMEWSSPAARMREFVTAMRAIWSAWHHGENLDFRGDFYRHTLMTPFFSPGESPYGAPPVYLAAVGPLMTKVAGEVCDGILAHSFTTERYLREVTLPAVAEGAGAGGRSLDDVAVNLGLFVVSGYDEEERAQSEQFVKGQIAFYGSTPAYRRVLDLHGWGELGEELNRLSKQGEWATMGGLIDDEVVDAFAVVAEPHELGDRIAERYGDVVDRVSLYTTVELLDDDRAALMTRLRGL
jgi:probable F420-dependent oxidoreductase